MWGFRGMSPGGEHGVGRGVFPGLRHRLGASLESPARLTAGGRGDRPPGLECHLHPDLRPGSVTSMLGQLGRLTLLLRASVSPSV